MSRIMLRREAKGAEVDLVGAGQEVRTLGSPSHCAALVAAAIQELDSAFKALSVRNAALEGEVWNLKQLVCLDHPEARACNK